MIPRLILMLAVATAGLLGAGQLAAGAGEALLPDLITLPPSDLRIDKLRDGTSVLRFSNTIWNAGMGRLELEGNPNQKQTLSRQIYQNLYDAPIGGTLVSHKQVASDVVFHEQHQHFHFADFADYLLLRKTNQGWEGTTKKGTKTSFCIMDTARMRGSYPAQYTSCGMTLQGMTVGWGDTYGYRLAGQSIDLGNERLGNGTYAVQSTADPKNVLAESNDGNNMAMTCFTVERGRLKVTLC